MKSRVSDKARLQHIMDSITEISTAIEGKTKEAFIGDHILRIAVVKWIEIIGEAANHITTETKETARNIEWKMIVGLRHIVVHEYFGINYDAIWNIAVNDIPVLGRKIKEVLKAFE